MRWMIEKIEISEILPFTLKINLSPQKFFPETPNFSDFRTIFNQLWAVPCPHATVPVTNQLND